MEKINDTLLIGIDIGADNGDLSIVEVITHVGTVRTVLNTFVGDDAELIYKVLTNKYDKSYLQKLKKTKSRWELYSDDDQGNPYMTIENDEVIVNLEEINNMQAVWDNNGKITDITQLEGYFETHYALPEITWETDANKEITEMIESNIASEVEAAEPKER